VPLLFIVEDVFAIKERGVLAIGKLANADARFRIDDPVQVRRQDGSVVRTAITGIPMGMMKIGMAEVLLRGLDKSDILPGDEVWLEDASEQSVALDGPA
jgi:hypothetical protein